jgi:LysM repeat protein
MSNEIQVSSELELVEKLAVAGVFLLAGLYLWQFMGDNDAVESISSGMDKEEPVSSSNYYQAKESDINEKSDAGIVKSMTADKEKTTLVASSKEKSRASENVINKQEVIAASETVVAPVSVPSKAAEIIEKNSVSTKKVPVIEVLKINPISGDMSNGILNLSGTGEPGGRLFLLLNGKKTTEIIVGRSGSWKYDANLAPGDYSIQVLTPEFNKEMNNQAALTHISIPKVEPLVEKIQQAKINPVEKIAPAVQANIKKSQVINNNYYYVEYGDTLNQLSKRFKVSLASILRANSISNKDVIEINQKLIIPGHYSGKGK